VSHLPDGWLATEIGEIAVIETGNTPSKADPRFFGGPYPFFKPGDLDGGGLLEKAKDTLSAAGFEVVRKLPKGSVLVTCIGNLGKSGVAAVASASNQQINAILPTGAADSWFIYYWSRTIRAWLEENSSATTVSIINKGRFSRAPINLPPFAEQRRIVAKLDALTARTASARAELDRVPALVARYKQALLAVAFRGELTAGWRAANSGSASSSGDLVGRPDVAGLPQGWVEAAVQELTGADGVVTDGDWVESKDQDPDGEVRLIQLADVGDGHFLNKSRRFMNRATADRLRCTYLIQGDLLIARMPDPLGRACIFPGVGQDAVTAVDVLVWRSDNKGADARWLMHAINSPNVRAQIESEAGGTTRQRIAGGRLKALRVPVPPLEEQRQIAAKLDDAFTEIDRLAAEAAAARRLLDRLDQAILAKAFRGELVPQDPADETASVLLDRLRAERGSATIGARRSRKLNVVA
jgi:type I restriction enzyme S subunit